MAATVEAFGGLDICVNNASAISLTGTLETEMKRFDLMNQINARGTFLVSKLCLPHLLKVGQSACADAVAAAWTCSPNGSPATPPIRWRNTV